MKKFRAWNNYQDEMISWEELLEQHYNKIEDFEDSILEFMQTLNIFDKNRNEFHELDISKLVLADGEIRYFVAKIGTIERLVQVLEGFEGGIQKVQITGIYFEWTDEVGETHQLLPCIDEFGVSDVSKMEIVGNVYEDSELLEGSK